MTVGTVLKSDVYHVLPADRDCIKVRTEFSASEHLFAYFVTFNAMLPPCVLSTAQIQEECSLSRLHLFS
jgi:hypothetical protein